MSQINHGLHAVLSIPIVYDCLQNIFGAKRARVDLVKSFIRPEETHRILDIGCGTAEILKFLPLKTGYVGYDVDGTYISAARQRFGQRGRFHFGVFDADAAKVEKPFDIVLMLGALHHMDDDVALSLLSLVADILSPSGRLITIDPCFVSNQNPIAHFFISKDRGQNIRSPNGYKNLLNSIFPNVSGSLRHRTFIPYTHWIMECSK